VKLPHYISLFRARWWLIALVTLVCAVASYGVSTRVLPKQYTASATFEVSIPSTQLNNPNNAITPGQVATDAQLATSYTVAQGTINALHLQKVLTPDGLIGKTSCSPSDVAQTFSCSVTYSNRAMALTLMNKLAEVIIATNYDNQTKQLQPLLQQVKALIAQTKADLQTAQAALRTPGADTAGLTTRIDNDNQQLNSLQGQQLSLQQSLLGQLNSIILLDPAQAPQGPTSPRPLVNTLLAALVGLMIGVGGVLLADYLDDSPRSPEHLSAELGVPIFASLPRITRRKGQLPETVTNPHSDAAEAYRILRTSIRFANVDAPIRSLLVTSSTVGEGKTTTATNLAVTFAQAGVRVVLVDADLRRPTVHEAFDLDNTVGLTTVLYSPLPPNPAELLSSRRMHRVMEHLSGFAELVIVDSPPLLHVADPVVLALMTDASVLVTDVEHSSLHGLQRAKEALAAVGVSVAGIVLNKVPRGRSEYYYYADGHRPETVEPFGGAMASASSTRNLGAPASGPARDADSGPAALSGS
jgi:Mrp family chromosome partitioning ATPase/capsular polysaccharide biosynthesis protein